MMSDDPFQDKERRPRSEPSVIRLAGWLLPALGLLAFELTASPTIGVAIACLKFGWEEWLSAWWLWRSDPDRPRGRACGWMFVASGFRKSVIVAFLGIIGLMILFAVLGPRPQAALVLGHATVAGTTAVFGFILLVLSTTAAVVLALRAGVKVWVGPDVHRARRSDVWPPTRALSSQWTNQAYGILTTAMVVCYALIAVVVTLALIRVLIPWLPNETIGFLLVVFVLPTVGSIVVLAGRDIIHRRVIADFPWDCWPLGEILLGGTETLDWEHIGMDGSRGG